MLWIGQPMLKREPTERRMSVRTIYCLVAFHFLALASATATESNGQVPRLIVISFDGFRADYLNETLTPTMWKLAKTGVIGERMESLFVTKTFPNHFAMVTGLNEESHGIVHNEMYDPVFNATFTVTNTETRWWDNGYSKPLWVINELYNNSTRFSGSMMWPGGDVVIDHHGVEYLQRFSEELKWRDRVDMVAEWMTNSSKPANCVFMYFNEPDKTAHAWGPFSTEVYDEVKRADDIVKYLLESLERIKLRSAVNVVIVSDHGMAEIDRSRVIELNKLISPALYSMYGASPVWNIWPHDGQLDNVYNTLKSASLDGHFSVYKKADIPTRYHYTHNRRIGEIFIVADDGFDIARSWQELAPYIKGKVWGNHGYDNTLPSMRPLFLASGPAFRVNYVENKTFVNVDLYPLMCSVLELFPENAYPSNGTLEKVHQMLVRSWRQTTDIPEDETMNGLKILGVFAAGVLLLVSCASCFVFCASNRRHNREEIFCESSHIDLHSQLNIDEKSTVTFSIADEVRMKPEEAMLLLHDSGDDDEL